eukprot:TRINITY_DN6240_c0_g1_i1.p1 TRINITY_DN6240_c0_g1~~TRINITY_DN6240_c0_g1_i1.p1  ORF type:complete len:189 (+),score=38.58 TRINITY_DN6240_c0_g1_i1:160-726(+)
MASAMLLTNSFVGGIRSVSSVRNVQKLELQGSSPARLNTRGTAAAFATLSTETKSEDAHLSRRKVVALAGLIALALPPSAHADVIEVYKKETQDVISKVRTTLALDRNDPSKPDAVSDLRVVANDWVAKYRREKQVAGKPSFSNMYSVLNAIAGHYVSFGANYPIPAKRQTRILEEVDDAEKALGRGK